MPRAPRHTKGQADRSAEPLMTRRARGTELDPLVANGAEDMHERWLMRMRRVLGALLGLVLLGAATAVAGASAPVTSLNRGYSLWSASFPDHQHSFLVANDARACGQGKTVSSWAVIEASSDGGGSWKSVAELPYMIASLHMTNALDGWALAALPAQMCGAYLGNPSSTRLLRTTDGGRSWHTVYIANGGYITGIAPVGETGAYLALFVGHGAGSRGQLLYTGDSGRHFGTVLSASHPLFAVAASGQTVFALAAGEVGKGGEAVVWRSMDGARRWTQGPMVDPAPTFELTQFVGSSLVATSPETAWLGLFAEDSCAMHGCVVSTVYRSGDGGRIWQMEPSAGVGCVIRAPLIAASGHDGLAVSTQNLGACSGAQSAILVSEDGGPFHLMFSSAHAEFTAIGYIPGGGVFALTSRALYLSRTGGRSWTPLFTIRP